MRSFEPRVFVIDDKKDEVSGIIEYYNNLGIGCKYLNSDLYEGDEFPVRKFSDVNVVFLDLLYSEKPFDPELCASWIECLVPERSFYLLVLWTKDSAHASDVISTLVGLKRTPFKTIIKSKTDYPTDISNKYNFTKLFEDIESDLDSVPALSEIFVWKKNIQLSTNAVIGNLIKTSEPITVNNKLKKIIVGHGGTALKTSTDNVRKRQVLFDALDSVLVSNTKKGIQEEKISKVNNETLYDLSLIEETNIDSELNSWFHFKLDNNLNNDIIIPGLIAEFQENTWKELYSIHDDKAIVSYLSKQTGDNLRISSIVLLLSRPCDIAQNKYGKNLKLLSGLKIVNPVRKTNARKEFSKGSSDIDSVKLLDHLFFNDDETDVTLLFDFRYNFSVPEEVFKKEFDNIKIFNKELLSEMQVEYSSYSSRLGITQVF